MPADKGWDAFADDQLGPMDHLGIREFFYMGYCQTSGRPFTRNGYLRLGSAAQATVSLDPCDGIQTGGCGFW